VVLKIVQAGHPVLRQVARELTPDEIRSPRMQSLIEMMRDTMRDAPGVGLAAPQVGLGLQLAVIEDPPEYMRHVPPEVLVERGRQPVPFQVIINPRLTLLESEGAAEFHEGCLSVSGYAALVRRAFAVEVEALDERAQPVRITARGWYARILQHEIDHLHGHLYIDRMESRSFATVENQGRYWSDKTVAEVRQSLGLDDPARDSNP
jgi:peptide deformylase